MTAQGEQIESASRQRSKTLYMRLYKVPWWLMMYFGVLLWGVWRISSDGKLKQTYYYINDGIVTTISLALTSYGIALVIGLFVGAIRSQEPRPPDHATRFRQVVGRAIHALAYNVTTFYVEFMRGMPPLVFLLVLGYGLIPAFRDVVNGQLLPILRDLLGKPNMADLSWTARDPATAVAGLSFAYGAFLSEVFRAGIQSVERGQIEAAKSLGMSYFQVMRFIVVPQAFRRILPPLANDFISMTKDTSLVTILGTNDITMLARKWASSSFRYMDTYGILALIYLYMTGTGSLASKWLENYLKTDERES